MRAQEAEVKPSPEGVPGASRPPFIIRIEVDAVASVREGQVDVEPHQFRCSTGIIIGNLTRLIHTLLYVMTIHTYIHIHGSWG